MLNKLPFTAPLNKDLLDKVVQQGLVELINGVLDSSGAITTRPGLVETLNVTPLKPITGLTYWHAKKQILFTANGVLFTAVSTSDDVVSRNSIPNKLSPGTVQFAMTPNWVYVASTTGRLLKWNGTDDAAALETDPVAPISVSSVVFINGRILALESDRDRIWYTLPEQQDDPTAPLVWSGYFDAVRSTDPVLALVTVGTDLVLLRKESLEFWYDDGQTPFRPVPGGSQAVGIETSRSFTVSENSLYWLSNQRTFMRMTGRSIEPLSLYNMDSFLKQRVITDGMTVSSVGKFIILSFPDEGKTGIYDTKYSTWYEWSTLESGRQKEFLGRFGTILPARNAKYIVAGRDGYVYFLSEYALFQDGGNPCQMRIQTPHHDHGTMTSKHSLRTMVKVSKRAKLFDIPPELALPPAIRCSAYSYQFPDRVKWRYSVVSALPIGFTFDENTATLAGIAECYIGSRTIRVRATNEFGMRFYQNLTLVITDFVPSVWIEE